MAVVVEQRRKGIVPGPVVWWLRNDLRLADNPVLRAAVGEAFTDGRKCCFVFIFDARLLASSPYGRVTDPTFEQSISTRKPVSFGNRKCSALRARFWLYCVRAVAEELRAKGAELLVSSEAPEAVLGALPGGSLVLCQAEPVSLEQSDIENFVEVALAKKGSALRREWGAMSLYHRDDLPFRITESEAPGSYTELAVTLGWDDIWSCSDRQPGAIPVRPPEAVPSCLPPATKALELPGLMPPEVLGDDAAALYRLGYTEPEIEEALGQAMPSGGEPSARALLERWVAEQEQDDAQDNPQSAVYWDLPVGWGSGEGCDDPMKWANLARPNGWMRISHYLALGCVSAREVFASAARTRNFNGVAHRLLWRDFHRLNAIKWGRRLFWLQGPGRIERPWTSASAILDAWRFGKTGLPYVDACMRELRRTGWLAYKGRKTVAHVLVFGMGADWRAGAFCFEELLLDYDCAMNYGNWVTVAHVEKPSRHAREESGMLVQEFVEAYREDVEWKLSSEMANDPSGIYIRKWVPELANVDDVHVHAPWEMSLEDMARCGCTIRKDYPSPVTGPLTLTTDEAEWEQVRSTRRAERQQIEEANQGKAGTKKQGWNPCVDKGEGWIMCSIGPLILILQQRMQ